MNGSISPKTIAPGVTRYAEDLALILTGPPCQDCNADVEAFVNGPIVAVNVMHDDGCPAHRARTEKRSE